MNADERKSLIKDIVDVLEVRVISPLEKRIDARFKALEDTDVALKAKVSGQHRAVTGVLLPQLESGIKADRLNDVAAIAATIEKLAHVVNDSNDRSARTEETVDKILQNSNSARVALSDGKGGTSIRPASMVAAEASLVAAESSVRTENKQESLGKLQLDAALETTQTKNAATATKKVGTATLVVTGVLGLLEIIRFVASLIPHQ